METRNNKKISTSFGMGSALLIRWQNYTHAVAVIKANISGGKDRKRLSANQSGEVEGDKNHHQSHKDGDAATKQHALHRQRERFAENGLPEKEHEMTAIERRDRQ